jgi:hypothetical protein
MIHCADAIPQEFALPLESEEELPTPLMESPGPVMNGEVPEDAEIDPGLLQLSMPPLDDSNTMESSLAVPVAPAAGAFETSDLPPPGTLSPDSIVAPLTKTAEALVGTRQRNGALSALGKQLLMRQRTTISEKPTIAAAPQRQPAAPAKSGPGDISRLLKQFQLTNGQQPPSASMQHRGREQIAALPKPPQIGSNVRVPVGSLLQQWTMTTSDNFRTQRAAPGKVPNKSHPSAADRNLTIAVPAISNPFQLANKPDARAQSPGREVRTVAQVEELPPPTGPSLDGGGAAGQDAGREGGDEPKALADAEKLGEEPEDTSLQFLRDATVLLDPGESQFDIGVTYLYTDNSFPILLVDDGDNVVGVEDVDFRIRELAVPMEYRFGLVKRVQAFIGASVGWSNTQVAIDSFEAFQNDGGFGDIDFGATAQLVDGSADKHYMLATIAATAPTGGDPFGPAAALATSAPSLGQGFWSISGNVLCIKSYDPMVFYYGVGTEHFIGREFNGREIDPGANWNYRFGVGFAVNEKVTLSTRFQGSYIEEVKVDRERVLGSNLEPMSLRLAATIARPCDRLVEPFVEFGLTDAAVSSYFGVTWTF